MRVCKYTCLTGLLVLLPMLGGCGSSRPATAQVTGEVHYKGQPVEGATVVFSSAGPPAQGITDAAGKFSLRTYESEDGATLGTHRITISKLLIPPTTAENPYPISKNLLPQKYSRPDTSGLSEEVNADANSFRFDLTD